jgi:hypothetical protein
VVYGARELALHHIVHTFFTEKYRPSGDTTTVSILVLKKRLVGKNFGRLSVGENAPQSGPKLENRHCREINKCFLM